jgi:mannosyltransferase OCH1-like enzyme
MSCSLQSNLIYSLMTIPIPIKKNKEKYQEEFYDCVQYLKKHYSPLITMNYSQKIPLKIHQTHNSNKLNSYLYNSCMVNINSSPEYEFIFYDENDRISFISNNYPAEYLDAYNSIIPGAYKADLFRYLLLYKEGGVYIDCKSSLIVPLRNFINSTVEFLVFIDRQNFCKGILQNAFIASVPGHPVLKEVIEMCITNITNKKYNVNLLDITGPLTLGRAFFKVINQNICEPSIGDYVYNIKLYGHFVTHIDVNGNRFETFVDKDNNIIINRVNCPNYYNNLPDNDYRLLWNSKGVYK